MPRELHAPRAVAQLHDLADLIPADQADLLEILLQDLLGLQEIQLRDHLAHLETQQVLAQADQRLLVDTLEVQAVHLVHPLPGDTLEAQAGLSVLLLQVDTLVAQADLSVLLLAAHTLVTVHSVLPLVEHTLETDHSVQVVQRLADIMVEIVLSALQQAEPILATDLSVVQTTVVRFHALIVQTDVMVL